MASRKKQKHLEWSGLQAVPQVSESHVEGNALSNAPESPVESIEKPVTPETEAAPPSETSTGGAADHLPVDRTEIKKAPVTLPENETDSPADSTATPIGPIPVPPEPPLNTVADKSVLVPDNPVAVPQPAKKQRKHRDKQVSAPTETLIRPEQAVLTDETVIVGATADPAPEYTEVPASHTAENPEDAEFGSPETAPVIETEQPVDPENLPPVEVHREPGMKILMIASEFSPLINAGGLGDAVSGLAAALVKLGHEVRVVIPRYSGITYPVEWYHGPMGVWLGNTQQWCIVCKATGPGNVPVFLIEFKEYYERWGLYHAANMDDYKDNPARFAFLCRAAFQFCSDHNWSPDIVHAHDWQTAPATAYLKDWYWNNPVLSRAASVLTIHNIAYQGKYPRNWFYGLGLSHNNFTGDKFEDNGMVNMLKGGIAFADLITTVSPTHAGEISRPGGGWGLAPFLSNKGDRFRGIVNGIDYGVWSPENDPSIPERYTAAAMDGKKVAKRRLQEEFGLNRDENIAIIGAIGRFVDQKGFQLLQQEIEPILNTMHVQFIILGTGQERLQGYFRWLPSRYPGRVGSHIGFNNWLAHLITAGSDLFIMPSIYEPCGLNQMYSQRYGTLPIVHATGGLEDTVENYNQWNGDGTGFKFRDVNRAALYHTVGWAVQTYYDRRDHFLKMRYNAMCRDFSWENSARQYVDAYKRAILHKQWYDSCFR